MLRFGGSISRGTGELASATRFIAMPVAGAYRHMIAQFPGWRKPSLGCPPPQKNHPAHFRARRLENERVRWAAECIVRKSMESSGERLGEHSPPPVHPSCWLLSGISCEFGHHTRTVARTPYTLSLKESRLDASLATATLSARDFAGFERLPATEKHSPAEAIPTPPRSASCVAACAVGVSEHNERRTSPCEFRAVDTFLTPNGVFGVFGRKGGFRKSCTRNRLGEWAIEDLNL